MRTAILVRLAAALLCGSAAACATASPDGPGAAKPVAGAAAPADGLLLLGTSGGPLARADRAGIASLLSIGGKAYLVDAGEGLVHQLGRAGLQPQDVPLVFLTHLHDDHYAGLPALASFAYTTRAPHLDIHGPAGTADLVHGLWQVMGPSARIRMVEQHIPRRPEEFAVAHEFVAGPVFDDGTVRVSAVANCHYDLPSGSPAAANLSYSLRFEGGGRTVVFTGDTGPCPAVAQLARGADVLVSEMASHTDREAVPPFVRPHMDREHLSPLEVGKLAAAAGVKTLVLTHIGVADESDLAVIRSVFKGRVVLGADLARIPL